MNILFSASGGLLILFSLLLFSKKEKRLSDYLLGSWFLLILFVLIVIYINHNGIAVWQGFSELADSSVFLHGPVIWWYTRALTEPDFRLRRRASWHILPFLLSTTYLMIYLGNGMSVPEVGRNIVLVTKMLVLLAYGVAALRQLQQHDANIENYFSYTEKIKLSWFRRILWGLILIWMIGMVSQILFAYQVFDIPQNGGYYTNLALGFFVLLMGFFGIRQTTIFVPDHIVEFSQERSFAEKQNQEKMETPEIELTEPKDAPGEKKYQQLLDYMTAERPHLDGELTLFKLSMQVEVPPHQLSKLINQYGGTNFFEFINHYRVAEVQKKIKGKAHEQQTLLAIALDSGFNSKASFNRVFKKVTGKTPKEYIDSLEG